MKRTFPLIWSLFLLVGVSVRAQYLIAPVTPPPIFAFNDLWHFSLTRPTADNLTHFYVSLRVLDGNNQLQVKSNTATFMLPVGTHYYNSSNLHSLQPFVTSFHGSGLLQQTVSSGGAFPPGTYALVYTLYGRANDGEFVPLCEDALTVTVEALWPPMLLSPADGESINTAYPLLTWTPAFSSSSVGAIDYTLNLVEILPGQNAYQAIQANPMYFTRLSVTVTALPYPAAAQVLEVGKKYAWQVHARAGGSSLGSSEVWWFTLTEPAMPGNARLPKSYFKPSPQILPDFVQLRERFLPIALEERYQPSGSSSLRFTILNEKKEIVGTEKDFDAVIHAGTNRYLIPVCSSEGNISLPNGKYFLEIHLEKKIRQYLAFQIQETRCHEE